MIIPVRFHILIALIFVQILSFGQPNASQQSCSQEISVTNTSNCQLFLYMQFFDGSFEPQPLGELRAGDVRTISIDRDDVYVFAVNDLNQQVAGSLSYNCESRDFEVASCFVESSDMADCGNLPVFSMSQNTSPRPVFNTAFASCGDQFKLIAVPDEDGIVLWTTPSNEKVTTRDDHSLMISNSIDELMAGSYTIEWFGFEGCYIKDEINLDVANCCSLRNELIQDTIICDTSSLIITSSLSGTNFCSEEITGYVESLVKVEGGSNISDLNRFEGEPDSYGPRLLRELTNRETYLLFEFGELVPKDSEICFLIRQATCTDEFNNSNFEISAGIETFSLNFSQRFSDQKLSTLFEEYCITVAEDVRFAKIEDFGNGCGIRLDAVQWRNNVFFNDFDYLWSTGETTESIEVNQPGLYALQITDCNGCKAYNEVEVAVQSCNEDPPPPPPCDETFVNPSSRPDFFRMCFGEENVFGNVGLNDSDADGFSLRWNESTSPSNGRLDFRPNGEFFYIPDAGFVGTDQFLYTVCKQDFVPCNQDDLEFECTSQVATIEVVTNQFSFQQDRIRACEGESVTLEVPSNLGVLWSTESTSHSISVTQPGVYTATVTNSDGCVVADQIEVFFDQRPIVELSKSNDLSCSFDSAILSAEGGSSYQWNTGQTGELISVNRPGLYEVTANSSQGCTSTASILVEENIVEVSPQITGARNICSTDEQVILSAFGGDSYEWSTGQSGQSVSVIGPGIYNVTATNNETGCNAVSSVEIDLVQSFADAGPDRTACPGTTVVIGASSNVGPENSTFTWSNGSSGIVGDNSSGRIIVVGSQTQSFTLQVNNNGCIVEDVVTVFVEDLNLQTTPSQNICLGESVVLSAEGASTYLWSTGETTPEITVAPTESQSYNVMGFSEAGCLDQQTISVVVSDLSQSSISDDQSICQGETITIGASGGSVYEWSNGAIGSSITISPIVSTTYTVTITNEANCQVTESVTIDVAANVNVDLGPDRTVCINETVELIAQNADSYLWSNGQTAQSIQVFPAESQTYSVTITRNGCTATDDIFIDAIDCFGSISGFALDNLDNGFANNTIFLFDTDNNLISTSTNANGFYQFTSLAPGDYVLVQAEIAGYEDLSAGKEPIGNDDATTNSNLLDIANNNGGTNNTIIVNLEAGEDDTNNIFRDQIASGSITGFAYDEVGDPIENSIISLFTSNGIFIGSTITNIDGLYQFPSIPTGDYIIEQQDISGFVNVSDFDESTDDDNDVDGTNNLIFATVESGEVDDGNIFRDERANGSISGFVSDDLGNPMSAVNVFLFDASRTVLISSISTNDVGFYQFSSLAPGNYVLELSTIPGYENESDFDESTDDANDVDGANNFIFATLEAGEEDEDNNFVVKIASGTITGFAWDDNGNPLNTSTTIFLFNEAEDDVIESRNTNTNDGSYQFTSIPAGNYVLVQGDIPGYNNFSDRNEDSVDAIDDGPDNRILVTLEAGVNNTGNIFRDQLIGGTISGFALDDNGDPSPTATIFLFDLADGDVINAISPNDQGFYQFTFVPPGNYRLEQQDIPGYINVSDRDEDPDDGNDFDEANNLIFVTLESGETDTPNNFIDREIEEVVIANGVISGFSLIDDNDDGEGDTPFLASTISLLDESGNVLNTTTVDAIGRYEFDELEPGNYIIQEDDVEGFGDVSDTDEIGDLGDQDGVNDPVDNRIPVVLVANENDRGNNFINRVLITRISGFVNIDLDADNILDEPLEGVSIDLFNSGGQRQARTETDANGFYTFVGIDPGIYILVEEENDAYENLYARDESITESDLDGTELVNPNQIDIILLEGEHDADNNFANFIPNVGTIAGFVLEDLDNDNIGDQGMGGVLISLFDLQNNLIDTRRTQSNGAYIFADITPGDYFVAETNRVGFEDISDFDLTDPDDTNDVDGADNIIFVSIETDELDDGNIFVNRRTDSAIIETCRQQQFDDFANGFGDFWIDGGTNVRFTVGDNFISAPGAIEISDDRGSQSSIFTRPQRYDQVNSINVNFYYLTLRADPDDYFVVEVSTNGGGEFTEVQRFQTNIDFVNEEWFNPTVNITGDLLSNQTVVRIRSELSSAAENLFLDDITVEICFDDIDDDDDGTALTADNPSDILEVPSDITRKFEISSEAIKNSNVESEASHSIELEEVSQSVYSIFPNPTSDYLHVKLEQVIDTELDIVIYDPAGRVVMKQQFNTSVSNIRLNVEHLDSNQLYILQIHNGNKEPQMLRFLKIN